ncbi:MAG: hypothetical protein Q7W16_04670 [Coriobacteriia bacterium]|nr:hypothetical protein [Coriobacteriia bacterium]
MLRPRLKMPMWAAVAVVAAAYAARSALRGWDFRPDLPIDVVIATTLVALVVLRATIAQASPPDGSEEQGPPEMPGGDHRADDPRHDDEVGPGLES